MILKISFKINDRIVKMPYVETEHVLTFFKDDHPFSNWFICSFEVEGISYNCLEQFMMAEKAKLFGDKEIWSRILNSKSQKSMKALGRQVKNFDESTWIKHREAIVKRGLHAKFTQNDSMKQLLLQTGSKIIAEGSPYDKIWGTGKAVDVTNPRQWNGTNLLGKLLMEVRSEL